MANTKRIPAAIALMALAGLTLCLTTPAHPASEGHYSVELRLWRIPIKGADDPIRASNRRVFDAFCLKHPEIHVRALAPLKIQGPAAEGNEFLAVAGGVAPDVFFLYGRKIGDYRAQGFLYPLNSYLAAYAKRHKQLYSGIAAPDRIWELCHDHGKIIAVPQGYYSMALMCDKAAFARAGLAGRTPKNWDELYTFARRLTYDPAKEPGSRPGDTTHYGIQTLAGLFAGWYYLQYVWSSGGDVVGSYYNKNGRLYRVPAAPVDYRGLGVHISNEKDYHARMVRDAEELKKRGLPTDYSSDDLEWRLETNSRDAIQALYFYRKLVHQPWIRNRGHEFDITPAMFKSKKAVDPVTREIFDLDDPAVRDRIYYGVTNASAEQSGTIQLERVAYAMRMWHSERSFEEDPSRYMLAPFPSRAGCPPSAFMAGYYLAVNSAITAEDKPGRRDVRAVRDAAWKYIEFVTGPEAQKITIDTFVEFGLGEYIRPSLLKDAGYQDMLYSLSPDMLRFWNTVETHAHVEPYCKGFTHVMTRELGMAIEAVVNDKPNPLTGAYKRSPQAVMDGVVKNVNSMILGKMPESEVRRRSRIGWVVFSIMCTLLILGARKVIHLAMKTRSKADDNEGFGVGNHPAQRRLAAWVFLIPAMATIAIWAYYPLARGLVMGFQDYKILGRSSFVGLRNFVEVVSEPKFWLYLAQTLQYTVMMLGIGFLIPIGLAILLTEIPKGKVLYRTLYYLPAVTTGLVTLFLWKQLMYAPTTDGVINKLILWIDALPVWMAAFIKLGALIGALSAMVGLGIQARQNVNTRMERLVAGVLAGAIGVAVAWLAASAMLSGGVWGPIAGLFGRFELRTQGFLQDPGLSMLWVVIPVIWAGAGPGCLIYLAALKGIPEEQYEAADLDGAGIWHKLTNVTYPNLKALIVINLVGAVIAAFKESGNIFVMTGGGPEDATMTTGLYIWYNAFMFLNFGLATAMAWIMGALLVGFTLKQLQILNNIQFRSTAIDQDAKGGEAGGKN